MSQAQDTATMTAPYERMVLLPCPFCGSKAEESIGGTLTTTLIGCSNCDCPVMPQIGPDHNRKKLASRWNSREKRPEDVRLVSAVNSLLGYVTTCSEQNTKDWMDGLLRHINTTLGQIGDDDRIATFKDGFQVITPADIKETSNGE